MIDRGKIGVDTYVVRKVDRQIGKQVDRWIGRQVNRQIGGQVDRWIGRQVYLQIDLQKYRGFQIGGCIDRYKDR